MNEDILDSPIEDSNVVDYQQKLTAKDRYLNMFYEYLSFILMLAIPTGLITILANFLLADIIVNHPIITDYINFMNIIIFFTLLSNKDILAGQSITKRYTGQQVLDFKTKKAARPMQCLVRNITAPIWIVELFFVTNNPYRRLGDRLAGTIVVKASTLQERKIGLLSSLKKDWKAASSKKIFTQLLQSFLIITLLGIVLYFISKI